ncbi:MAG: phosphoadenylyl-sulfate reductase [Rhodobiaceae bacterium]|nr:phosphoadenylyl-sulfate reductase [Rhodobiaceae bacterium]MCC0055631.1 phosphoadenylyl-sulfate reductase [Rhodobiaceae bacterium]
MPSAQFAEQVRIPDDAFIAGLDRELAARDLGERLAFIAETFGNAVLTTSLGLEDQVLSWAVSEHARSIRLATLQTGRLFPETVALIATTNARFGLEIEEYLPEAADIESYKSQYGLNGFYDSVEARHACCNIRKVKPLKKALAGADAWITGLRRSQSDNRAHVPFAEWDEANGLVKLNPLADWTADAMQAAIAEHDIPVNPLHARGYPSIGCEPCTRAIRPGEPERAGRWWWENDEKRECGLHVPEASPLPNASQLPENAATKI